jgi:dipeptidyl aminopeptidase/acylaminoacyl peptidase
LGLLNTATQELKPLELPFRSYSSPVANAGKVLFIGEAGRRPAALVQLDLESGEWEVVAESGQLDVPRAQLSCPCPVQFETSGNETAYGYYYPPVNPDYEAPAGELPPLLVKMHGGPTSAASPALSLSIQYWTSRGFAVLDVDYRGSTGYGREYRNRLYHNWGVVDVDDCAAGARKLARDGKVDPDRLAIRGGSAGGFTALAALAFSDVFNAGASYYGVSDLEALARDTHKFESHYLDQLIGPYPQRRDLYEDRSPLGHVDRITAPIIFFQGLEDKIVPPDQSEAMVEALRERGVAVAYLPLAGEQHGFRNAESIKHTLEAELYFYSRVFNFEPADELPKVDIANLD